jgi:ABC-type antimicrobial peptide transport system permease subunit
VRCGGASQGSCPDPTLLRHRLTVAHPAIKVFRAAVLEDAYSKELARPRAAAALAFSFASTALAAAAAGLFSVLSYSVARRRRELGIRFVLGASPADARRQVLREGATIALPGIALGMAGGLLLSRALSSLQYGVTMTDPVSCAVIVTVLALTIAGASWYPTRDAGRTDPAVLLRET